MKQRIITGVSAALFAIGCLVLTGFGFYAWLSIPMALLSGIAAYEVLKVSKCKNKVLTAVAIVFAALVPFYIAFDVADHIPVPTSVLLIIYVLAVLIIMLKFYDVTRFEHAALALFASIAVPAGLSLLIQLVRFCGERPALFQRSHAVFFLLCAMFAAWLSDTYAYFFGSKFGKHKMTPKISPKKSWEGAIAGVVLTSVSGLIAYAVCAHFYFHLPTVRWWMVALGMPVLCVMGIFGDLSASVIKRNFGEKDFGNLFPGHGGVLDRIDSFLFTLPTTYVLVVGVTALCGG
ncbi:MAG: phosphatidate cytidylyltransferase [Clostridia bacterium]|nr:phosphatidate cytidylyltransferase [Clostridia bacterium]